VLNQVAAQLDLTDIDLDCLDFIGTEGPLSPTQTRTRTDCNRPP